MATDGAPSSLKLSPHLAASRRREHTMMTRVRHVASRNEGNWSRVSIRFKMQGVAKVAKGQAIIMPSLHACHHSTRYCTMRKGMNDLTHIKVFCANSLTVILLALS